MKAIFINGKENMELKNINDIKVGDISGKVLIQPEYVGICGSDIHYLAEGASGIAVIKEPLTPGHELGGKLLEDITIDNKLVKKGTPVTVHPATYGKRLEDQPDNPEVWPEGAYLGSARYYPHKQGAMVEKMFVDKSQIRVLPQGLDTKLAALAEPLSVGIHAINLAGGVKNKRVLVSGAGPIGYLAAIAATTLDAKEVVITDVLDEPLARINNLNGIQTVNVTKNSVEKDHFDVILECSGAPAAVNASMKAAKIGGTVIQVGMLPNDNVGLNLSDMNTKQIIFKGSYRFNDEIDEAIQLLNQNNIFNEAISHVYSIDDYEEAFETARDAKKSCKVLIEI
ncbi:zinc-binding dehydrogenase [Staphylococcus sp. EZ-P03]|uniref:zinc-binding dehydrogenase n=1 Tax=Staphylococcus sp. EZ-P03 TaxID=2282739 RepID=UPI000DF82D5D|nr:zinc-binding dehydrogenase [Staphylococcus sp. EZ-P03]